MTTGGVSRLCVSTMIMAGAFAESKYFSPVSLLAEVWQVSAEDAAAEALRRSGYKPATYAHLWEQAVREPDPDRESLAKALTVWCSGQVPDWKERQYDDAVAAVLGKCLGLLPRVRTQEECLVWLEACQKAMHRCLA